MDMNNLLTKASGVQGLVENLISREFVDADAKWILSQIKNGGVIDAKGNAFDWLSDNYSIIKNQLEAAAMLIDDVVQEIARIQDESRGKE